MEADTLDAFSLFGGDIDMDYLDFPLTSANIHNAPPSDISSLLVPPTAMIACSTCTDDVFLLVVLSMVVLKILERYAEPDMVARLADSIVLGPVHAHDGSVPAQLFFGELHHVQRLVDQLSPRLRAKGQTEGGGNDVEVEGQDFASIEETSRSQGCPFLSLYFGPDGGRSAAETELVVRGHYQ